MASAASRKVPSPAGRLNPPYRNREWNLPRLAAVCSRVRCGAVRCGAGWGWMTWSHRGGGFAIRSARVCAAQPDILRGHEIFLAFVWRSICATAKY